MSLSFSLADLCGCPGGDCAGCCSVTSPCCVNPLATVLYATVTDYIDCTCLAGLVIPLTYNSITEKWEGSGVFCGVHTIDLAFYCTGGGVSCSDMKLDAHWPDGCVGDHPNQPGESCACDPLLVVFRIEDFLLSGCGCNVAATVGFYVTISE